MAGDVVRTDEERFEGLPDFDFEPVYREIDGLRLAHIDAGEGQPVIFFHGEPTWSYLWRKVIGPVRDAGYRCVAPDYAGLHSEVIDGGLVMKDGYVLPPDRPGLGVVLTAWNVVRCLKKGIKAGPDPWKANTLEWFTPSPPPVNNFDVIPRVRSVEPMKDIRRQVAKQTEADDGHGLSPEPVAKA